MTAVRTANELAWQRYMGSQPYQCHREDFDHGWDAGYTYAIGVVPDMVRDVLDELERATAKFPAFNSAHEGYAILLEEVEELKNEVFWGPTGFGGTFSPPAKERRLAQMRAEAVQVAAMALRFIRDVCEREEPANA